MSSNENYIIEECRYCGNKTKLDIVGKYIEYGEPEELIYEQNWLMLKCCVCNKISLTSLYSGEDTIICLMALRRTLEIICKDMGARGKTLEKKILDLTEKVSFQKLLMKPLMF